MRTSRRAGRAVAQLAVSRPANNNPRPAYVRRVTAITSNTTETSRPVPSRCNYSCSTRHASTSASPSHAMDKGSVLEENPPMPGPSNLPASTDLLEVYRGMVAQGRLAWDEEQVRIVMRVSARLVYFSEDGAELCSYDTCWTS